jgi:preprotein translocase subunit YajC
MFPSLPSLVSDVYAMGPPPAGAGQQQNPIMAFLPLIIIFAIFYFMLIRPQQKKAKELRAFLESLKRGDEVVTQGGIYGRIEKLTDDVVTLQVADKVSIRVARSQIAGRPPKKEK